MPRIARKPRFGEELIEAMTEVLDHVQGRRKLRVHRPRTPSVTQARETLAMTQVEFAGFLSVPLSTVQKWERGATNPSGAARVLLEVIRKEPEAVRRAVAGGRRARG